MVFGLFLEVKCHTFRGEVVRHEDILEEGALEAAARPLANRLEAVAHYPIDPGTTGLQDPIQRLGSQEAHLVHLAFLREA